MSGSKLGVLGLSLLSTLILFYGALLALFPVIYPPVLVYHDQVTNKIAPGCFGIPVLLFMTFIALFPAMGALQLWRTRVRTRAAKERQENEYELQLEEQLQRAMARAVDLRLEENPEELPEAFVGEVRGFMDPWNRAHRARLFRFLRDLGFDADWVTAGDDNRRRLTPESADSLWERSQPLAVATVVAWFSLSFSLLLLAGLACLAPAPSAQIRPGQTLMGVLGCGFIPSLIAGLAGIGISWLFFQEKKASRRRHAARDKVQELILRYCTEVIEKLPIPRESSDGKCVVRAFVIAETAELDGTRKGRLLSLLQQSGWLDRDSGVDLRGANLQAASLAGARLSHTLLQRIDLSRADLSRADLQEANLRQCNLREADLRFANLDGADLRGADLRAARCQQARMGTANLEGALLDGANFWGADLRDTVLNDSRSGPAVLDRTQG
ncbi:MAG TPA: pentapeptide repeat-containing protein [Thermoanaerobaculia bacterium]|nr:pentapeptide repeat-containing protein [Thermoanaerobaculia bacterium]